MNFRNISSWCIRNPVGPIVLFVGLMLAGFIAFSRMQVNNAPDIDFPAAIVSVTQPGAAPNELETQVTQRVESAIRGINGVEEVNSSVSEGNSTTFVMFELGTPTDRAVNDVRNVISQIRSNLPDGILEPQVTRVDAEDEPFTYVGAQTTDMTLEQLSWYIDNTVAKRLLGMEGIAAVGRVGGVDRVIRVMLDPVALQAQGITAAQVNLQLRQSNLNAPGGRAEIAGSEQSVRVIGNAADAYELSQKQITLPGGRLVRLADLGEVKDSNSEQRSIAKMNGRQVVTFFVQRAKGSSEVTAYKSAWDELHKLEKENSKVHFSEVFNRVDYTKAQYASAMEGLILGAVLAVFVVFLFLRDFRATWISALAIPMSAIPAFWFMSMLGITLNFMSTMAMGLVAGVLVDDAIVEIENIVRHMRMGKSAYQASIDAADEIGLPVVATTFSIVAVFLPVGLMEGLIGQYFKSFGMTIVVTVLISLAVARLITPMIAAYFLKAKGQAKHGEGWLMDRYIDVLRWTLRHRWKTVGIGFACFVIQLFAFATLEQTFQPDTDDDTVAISVEMPPGVTLDQTRAVADQAAAMMRTEPDVATAFESVRTGNATIWVSLKDRGEGRERTSTEFQRQVGPRLQNIADARVFFRNNNQVGGRDMSVLLASS